MSDSKKIVRETLIYPDLARILTLEAGHTWVVFMQGPAMGKEILLGLQ